MILINRLVISILPIIFLITLASFGTGRLAGGGLGLGMNVGFLLALWLNARSHHLAARWLIFLFMILLITLLIVTYGRASGGYMTYLSIGIAAVLLFEDWLHRSLLLTLLLVGFGVSEACLLTHGPLLAEDATPFIYPTTFVTNFITLIVLMTYFNAEERRHLHETQALLADVQQQKAEAEVARQDLEQFAIAASHHMKTPIRNIHSFLGLIDRQLPAGSAPVLREYLAFAQQNSAYMAQLLRDLLQYTEASQVSRHAATRPASLPEVLDQVVTELNLDQAPGRLIYEALPAIPMEPQHAFIVCKHLITNGLTYNTSPTPTVEVSARQRPAGLCIQFADNGIGISEAYQEQVFALFARLHTLDQYPGTGLGLAISRKLAGRYGGDLRLVASSENGSVFELFFPSS